MKIRKKNKETVRKYNREYNIKNRDEINRKRREKYHTDSEERERRKRCNRESKIRSDNLKGIFNVPRLKSFFNCVAREEKKVTKKRIREKRKRTSEQVKQANYLKGRRHYLRHRKKVNKKILEWYHDHKETPEYKIKQVGYYEVNNAQRKERRDGMSEEERTEFNHNNYIKFKDSFAISHEKNRIERLSVKGEYTAPEWKAIKKICNYKCMNLNCYRDLPDGTEHKDHMIPLVPKNSWCGKGTNFIDNLQPLCSKCNIRKSNKYDVPNLLEIVRL